MFTLTQVLNTLDNTIYFKKIHFYPQLFILNNLILIENQLIWIF